MKLAAPLIVAAHVAHLPTLTPWAAAGGRPAVPVYEGAAVRRDDLGEWCTVGFVAGDANPAVTLEPVPTAQGAQTREVGAITSQLLTGQADVATARTRVFDLIAAWVEWLGADRTLGNVLLPGSELHLAVDVALATVRAGATANALITITYTAITYG